MTLLHRGVASLSWWQTRRSVRFRIVLGLALVPLVAGIIGIVGDAFQAREAERHGRDAAEAFDPGLGSSVQGLVLYSVLPLTALLLAGGLIADDVEDRTLAYLLARPIRRAQLYFSKLLPVALATGLIGAFMAASLWLCRIVSWALHGLDARVAVQGIAFTGTRAVTVDAGTVILVGGLGAVLAAFLLGIALASLFGCVSLLVPRFHFIANFLVYSVVELPFSSLGGQGFGFLTPTMHAVTLVRAFDPSVRLSAASDLGTAGALLAAPMMVAIVAAWVWIGVRAARRKDFNITSATG